MLHIMNVAIETLYHKVWRGTVYDAVSSPPTNPLWERL
jgi:hypothetical protein